MKPLVFVSIGLIRFYQIVISPLLYPRCRFYPSCSAYALDSFRNFGFFSGIFLMSKRLLKCHPFHPGGFDPVPSCQIKN